MFGQHDDFIVDKAGHIVAKTHVHDVLKPQRLEFGRTVQMRTVHLYLFRQDVGVSYREASFCKKLAEQINEHGIFIAAIVFFHIYLRSYYRRRQYKT